MKTIVKQENIFKYLESLRKLGFKAYVMQWAINEDSDFLVAFLPKGKIDKKGFTIQVESMSFRSKREKEFLIKTTISNRLFKTNLKAHYGN